MKVLVTGAAGFIGSHLVKKLISSKHLVIGIDNMNEYYDPSLKALRLESINENTNSKFFTFIKEDICNKKIISELFEQHQFDIVINLAAQAGVRYSLIDPDSYINSNILGFMNILENCRNFGIKHLIYASSSSVYGMNIKQPFSTSDRSDYPISLYAATKKSNELLAYSYSHLYDIPSTGLRFFTVYGEYGRPDMAYFSFTKKILNGEEIDVFNNGEMMRDFTYVADIVNGIENLMTKIPSKNSNKYSNSKAPHKIYNIGNNNPISLDKFIKTIENLCGKKAKKNFLPMQPGDVPVTYADIEDFTSITGFKPTTSIEIGMKKFYEWFIDYKN